jgi:hypothetical protein
VGEFGASEKTLKKGNREGRNHSPRVVSIRIKLAYDTTPITALSCLPPIL